MLIHDTTLRDGEQMPGVVFSYEEKLRLAELAIDFGVDFIDIMPSVSASETELAQELASRHNKHISATCRARKEDIELAYKLGIRQIVLFSPLSDIHLLHKLRISREKNLRNSLEMIDYADRLGLCVDFAAEDCTRADWNYLKGFLSSISDKIRIFYMADTVGYLTPEHAYDFVSELKDIHEDLGIHMHNDLGLATANTLAAIRAGAKCFSGTFTGIGERAGNAPIEEVCISLKYLYKKELNVKYERIAEICDLVEKYSGIALQSHKPLVGKNAFCHESGIHADGVIKYPATYEHVEPETVGRSRSFFFGKHTGRNVLRHFLGNMDEETILNILTKIKTIAQNTKYVFSEREIVEISRNMHKNKLVSYVDNK